MSDNSLVSVIIIFLNAEEFIEEAIESVFAQTYTDWELLLVDDGSSDNGTEIALRYAADHRGRVRYLEHDGHQNRGMSASRNLGIASARGEFIAFLDADDVWVPTKLEEQVAILCSQPEAAMVYGAIQWWYSWTGKPEDANRDFIPELHVKPETLVRPPELLAPLLRNESVTATNGLMRRAVIERLGGYEETFRGMYEDQVFYTKICLNAPVFVASKCWYRWRKHPRSACAVAVSTGEYESSRLIFLRWLRNYLSQQGVEDGEIRKALNEEMLKCRNPALFNLLRHTRHHSEVMKEHLKSLVRRALPRPVYRWIRARRHGENYRPAVGEVNFGSLRRVTPISPIFGFDRGQPIDRYYIEGFLARNAADVRGRVLEVGDDTYTRRFGGASVAVADVLYVSEGNPRATVVADLSRADHIASGIFDCIILTQTLHLIYDVRAAISTLHRILKPGGVLLATFPGISQIDHFDWGGSWYWAFTALSARRLFEESFHATDLKVETHGNVLTALAFLQGLATEELRKEELDYNDADYEVTIAVRAVKGAAS
ncbi:MAG TPA: glycosyltransferase [Blastocatellia bacterium]|nr:glycosyltransferase [Blastocatellia bacterium]